jgi:hypothetical protein
VTGPQPAGPPQPPVPAGLPSVFWLGGGPGSGKTTVAAAVARRLDLRLYPVDGHTYEHLGRAEAGGYPLHARLAAMTPGQRRAGTPEELAGRFVAASAERVRMIYEDLLALGSGPTVVVEGPQLFPGLVAPAMRSREHGLWLLPTAEFGRRGVERRGLSARGTATDQEFGRRLRRDVLLTGINREQAAARNLRVADVDGGRGVAEMVATVARQLARLPGGVIRATDGRQRQQIRRAENAVAVRQLLAWWRDMGPDRMPGAPVFAFSCECESPGCEQVVGLPVTEYQRRSVGAPVTAHSA